MMEKDILTNYDPLQQLVVEDGKADPNAVKKAFAIMEEILAKKEMEKNKE